MKQMNLACLGVFAATCLTVLPAQPASAHFRQLKPASWLTEDSGGNPQKTGPCGVAPNATGVATTGTVTTYTAGDTISVEWVDTIAHPGYFRIALAENRADFKNPTTVQGADCSFDESKVPSGAHDNVLADGIFFRSRNGFSDGAGKMFSQQITLPNTPCEKCTLQVMQIMESDIQAISNCYYFHCADIRIVAKGASTDVDAGTSSDASTGSPLPGATDSGTLGTSLTDGAVPDAGTPRDAAIVSVDGSTIAAADAGNGGSSSDSGGCALQPGRAQDGAMWALLAGLTGLLFSRRRRNA